MSNKIKFTLKNQLELRLAEVFWLLSDVGTATSQEIASRLGSPVHHIQLYLNILKGLGTITEEVNNCFSVSSPQPAKHLQMWLQYQAVCQKITNPKKQPLGIVPEQSEAGRIAQWSSGFLESILLNAIFPPVVINMPRPLDYESDRLG